MVLYDELCCALSSKAENVASRRVITEWRGERGERERERERERESRLHQPYLRLRDIFFSIMYEIHKCGHADRGNAAYSSTLLFYVKFNIKHKARNVLAKGYSRTKLLHKFFKKSVVQAICSLRLFYPFKAEPFLQVQPVMTKKYSTFFRERDHWRDPGIDGKRILRLIFKKEDGV
jgi:hypothetical protein